MTDLLNKYVEKHDEFVGILLKYYTLHEKFLERQSPQRTMDIRKAYKELRLVLKQMEELAQLRMKERRIEWGKTNRLKKDEEE
jgi:hypothetical protein